MTKKSRYVLLDSMIVITLHELCLWQKFCESYDVILPATVVQESHHFIDSSQKKREWRKSRVNGRIEA